jgi:hypothetical protein
MKIAIPGAGDQIAPVFDQATRLQISVAAPKRRSTSNLQRRGVRRRRNLCIV